MDARAIIAKIRRRDDVSAAEIRWFANSLASGAVSDAQAGAFAMAVCLNGLGPVGRVALTEGMRDSGDVLKWSLDGPVLDKHSTGGVGDCVSLILAPMLAACGVYVPMISGRGLGHTGGTLDKLEAVPGVSVDVDERRFRKIVKDVGCAIVSATGQIAPSDKRLYAVRDVTSTVDSIDLITASILAKKLAAGLGGLVLDVKLGSGAFMKTADDARDLATSLVDTANGAGCPTAALITDMNQPLAPALGNGLEIAVCMDVLSGEDAAPRLKDLALELGATAMAMSGEDAASARNKLEKALTSGAALERFAKMIAALGGPPDMAEDWRTHLPKARVVGDVVAPQDGYIRAINGEALGLAVVAMGGGRQVETDKLRYGVGYSDVINLGDQVRKGQPLATIHAATEDDAVAAAKALQGAVTIGEKPDTLPLVHERITS